MIDMKAFLIILMTVLVAIVAWLAYCLDQWLGIVAFTYQYLLFSAVAAMVFYALWFMSVRKHAILVGVAVFAILAANLLLPPPSERILRSVLLQVPAGTDAEAIERIVKEEYDGSGYVFPRITREDGRVAVSLLSQQSGNCTAIIFQTEDGMVVDSEFMAD